MNKGFVFGEYNLFEKRCSVMKSEHFVKVCRELKINPRATQRDLATVCKLSLGLVNNVIKASLAQGYLRQVDKRKLILTDDGQAYLDEFKVENAVILAAGFGSRCVPLTYETPKGLLEVHGEPMIERQIRQLLEVGITDITIVVGYKKEHFDYLIDKYGVKLVISSEYATKCTLSSIYCVLHELRSTYVLVSDSWVENNIFNAYEAKSWISCTYFDGQTDEYCVTASQSGKIKSITVGGRDSWATLGGPSYFSPSFSALFKQYAEKCYHEPGTSGFCWEDVVVRNLNTLSIYVNEQTGNVFEIENLEELRIFDPSYNEASNNEVLRTISKVFNIHESEIIDITPIKLGMTNRSFSFSHNNERFIMRIPGEGTQKLINRSQEYETYKIIAPYKFCDEPVYIDEKEGYKITKYLDNVRICDKHDLSDIEKCMDVLRRFHSLELTSPYEFDVFERLEFYESLWLENKSCFKDYQTTKDNVFKLKEFLASSEETKILSHIDAVPENFLFIEVNGSEHIQLIDWEYSGMCDPHIDIAMFAIYSVYDREHVEALIDSYFVDGVSHKVRLKIYAYIAVCGLLWSNWCEYKSHLGVEFGEYALRQYRFAKDYYRIFNEEKEKQ